ncbi:hypothetical protein K0T92_15200 [Paenibacillus oenotherae]|uniref:Uncharacterized protein n=1 Tax=Paenibacillus oenotherae TaxID=1435645 RepID=A0ABS7D931_9BACL|nr:hypothetical protein [Paenibacillus oenotherae]MBW7476091.1 hypothetical protein [Paenibacillus oenotherae]
MMNHMYIRHAVGGRQLLDSIQHTAGYEVEEAGSGNWKFVIRITDEHAAQQVLQHKNEMNLFVIGSGNTSSKTWYYSSDGNVQYDRTNSMLVIVADAKLDYSV